MFAVTRALASRHTRAAHARAGSLDSGVHQTGSTLCSKPLFCLGGLRCAHARTSAGTVTTQAGLRGRSFLNVIEVSKHELSWAKVEFYQGRALTQCIECWHERVALFTAFCLVNRVRPTCSIMPMTCKVKM